MNVTAKINIIWVKKNFLAINSTYNSLETPIDRGFQSPAQNGESNSCTLWLSLLLTIFYILVVNNLILTTDDKISFYNNSIL